jgi:polyhydroxyalkanoate synthesis regulator phasin
VLGLALAGAGVAREREEGRSVRDRFIERVAELLGEEPGAVRSAMERARGEIVDEAVARGDISRERANGLERRTRRQGLPPPGRGRGAFVGRIAERRGDVLTVRTPRGERRVRLDEGTAIRSRSDSGEDALRKGALVRVKGRIARDGVVEAVRIRVLPARQALTRGLLGQVREISDLLGMQPGELRAQLRQGKSLAEIAGPEKAPRVIEILTDAARRRLDAAVAAGRISKERAAERERVLDQRIESLMGRERPAPDDRSAP